VYLQYGASSAVKQYSSFASLRCKGAKRCKKEGQGGWCEGINEGVWDTIPSDELPHSVLKIPVKRFIFCILHMKVRVMGSILKYVTRDAEYMGTTKELVKAIQAIVRTFNITLNGELLKSTGKKNTKQAKVSAMQGQQVDKLLECIRNSLIPEASRTPDQQESAQLWTNVLESIGLHSSSTKKDKKKFQQHKQVLELFTQAYDLLNSKTKVTADELTKFQTIVYDLSAVWTKIAGGICLNSEADLTPSVLQGWVVSLHTCTFFLSTATHI
jgi:hypothetical protein